MSAIDQNSNWSKLTLPQQAFCQAVGQGITPNQAVKGAFGASSPDSCRALASKLLRNNLIRGVLGMPPIRKVSRGGRKVSSEDVQELQAIQREHDDCSQGYGVTFTEAERRVLERIAGEEREIWRLVFAEEGGSSMIASPWYTEHPSDRNLQMKPAKETDTKPTVPMTTTRIVKVPINVVNTGTEASSGQSESVLVLLRRPDAS